MRRRSKREETSRLVASFRIKDKEGPGPVSVWGHCSERDQKCRRLWQLGAGVAPGDQRLGAQSPGSEATVQLPPGDLGKAASTSITCAHVGKG